MQKIKPHIIVVAGPTASGKSYLAIALARRFDGEIVSADSRQVYRGMDIGTGKVVRDKGRSKNSKWRSNGIRHWMLDVASPKRQYSVVRWRTSAERAIRDIVRRGKLPIICGGTGFWIDALVYDLRLPNVKPDAKLRASLRKLTAPQLYARLRKLDPARAASIDRHNPVRLIRALEIVLVSGRPVPKGGSSNGEWRSPYDLLYLGVTRLLPELKRRIESRLDARLKAGMVAEVRRLHRAGVSWKRLESFGLEYRRVAEYLQHKFEVNSKNGEVRKSGTSSLDIRHSSFHAMRNALHGDIIAYAKRQLTWWRKNPDIRWMGSAAPAQRLAREFLRR